MLTRRTNENPTRQGDDKWKCRDAVSIDTVNVEALGADITM